MSDSRPTNAADTDTSGFRERAGGIIKRVPMILGIGLVLFLGVKGCVTTAWTLPKEPTTYLIEGTDGRTVSVTFLPQWKVIKVYFDPNEKSFEAVLSEVTNASYGTHYLGPVWNVSEDGESLFGLRWVTGGAEPVTMRFKVLNKYHEGHGDSAFPPIGGQSVETVYFRNGEMKYSGMWLKKESSFFSVVEPFLNDLEYGVQQRQ
jgi:hypothetical protein